MSEYLSWEVDLIERIARDGTCRFAIAPYSAPLMSCRFQIATNAIDITALDHQDLLMLGAESCVWTNPYGLSA